MWGICEIKRAVSSFACPHRSRSPAGNTLLDGVWHREDVTVEAVTVVALYASLSRVDNKKLIIFF